MHEAFKAGMAFMSTFHPTVPELTAERLELIADEDFSEIVSCRQCQFVHSKNERYSTHHEQALTACPKCGCIYYYPHSICGKMAVNSQRMADHSASQLHSLRSELATAKERIGELERDSKDSYQKGLDASYATNQQLLRDAHFNKSECTAAMSVLRCVRKELDEAQATITSQSEELEKRQWQDISTAPKDGTEILGYREDCGVILIRWTSAAEFLTQFELDALNSIGDAQKEDWFCADFVTGSRLEGEETPTHWMPLPEPPTSHSTKAEGENYGNI